MRKSKDVLLVLAALVVVSGCRSKSKTRPVTPPPTATVNEKPSPGPSDSPVEPPISPFPDVSVPENDTYETKENWERRPIVMELQRWGISVPFTIELQHKEQASEVAERLEGVKIILIPNREHYQVLRFGGETVYSHETKTLQLSMVKDEIFYLNWFEYLHFNERRFEFESWSGIQLVDKNERVEKMEKLMNIVKSKRISYLRSLERYVKSVGFVNHPGGLYRSNIRRLYIHEDWDYNDWGRYVQSILFMGAYIDALPGVLFDTSYGGDDNGTIDKDQIRIVHYLLKDLKPLVESGKLEKIIFGKLDVRLPRHGINTPYAGYFEPMKQLTIRTDDIEKIKEVLALVP